MLYADKYDNHFLNITCGRARFADFAGYTVNALKAAGTPAALAALAGPLASAQAAFLTDVARRTTGGGSTQDNTQAEDTQWTAIRAFLAETDTVTLRPAYFKNAVGLQAIYPAKLGGLTEATKGTRLAKFEAYVQALEAAAPRLTPAPGKAARKLLDAYRAVADTKDTGENAVAGLIQQLGPQAVALCEALFDVHCTGLATYSRTPALAAALFNYGLLPKKKRGPRPSKV